MDYHRTAIIARWEFSRRARTKGFLISIIAGPLLLGITLIIPTFLSRTAPGTSRTIAIVGATDSLRARAQAWINTRGRLDNGQPAYVLRTYPSSPAADSAILRDSVEGAVVLVDSAGWPTATYRSDNPGDFHVVLTLQQAVARAVRDERLDRAGIDTASFASLAPDINLRTVKVSERGDAGAVSRAELFITAIFFALLLEILLMSGGATMARSLLEEKSGRIMEILITSSAPLELMWGKLLGLTAIGLIQVLLWFFFGVLALGAIAGSTTIFAQAERIQSVAPWLTLYLLLGYFLYAAAYIGTGALATTEEEADTMQSWLQRFLAVPGLISIGIVMNPDAVWLHIMSFIPVFTPPVMMVRLVAQTPTTAEIIATLTVLALSVVVVTWLCARVFSTAILMSGKRPELREIWRWIRA